MTFLLWRSVKVTLRGSVGWVGSTVVTLSPLRRKGRSFPCPLAISALLAQVRRKGREALRGDGGGGGGGVARRKHGGGGSRKSHGGEE